MATNNESSHQQNNLEESTVDKDAERSDDGVEKDETRPNNEGVESSFENKAFESIEADEVVPNKPKRVKVKEETASYDDDPVIVDMPSKTSTKSPFECFLRYTSTGGRFLMLIAIILAICHGVSLPLVLWQLLAPMLDSFQKHTSLKYNNSQAESTLFEEVAPLAGYYALTGILMLIAGVLHTSIWCYVAHNVIFNVRTRLYRSILDKPIQWFEERETGSINTYLTDDIAKIETGLTDKITLTIVWLAIFFAGIVFAMISNWKLTLVTIASIIPMAVALAIIIQFIRRASEKQATFNEKAASKSFEILRNIRTIYAFNKQSFECEKYGELQGSIAKEGIVKSVLVGASTGMLWFFVNSAQAVVFWYAYTAEFMIGTTFQVLISIFVGALSLGQAMPNLEAFTDAVVSMKRIFEVIDDEQEANMASDGYKHFIRGKIELKNVSFTYPSRPNDPVLRDVSLVIEPGENVAIVGHTGSGKSTILQLIMNFYKNDNVLLDGKPLKDFNMKWLRQNLGYVGQEPTLFNASIEENIRLGGAGMKISQKGVQTAAETALVTDFVAKFPNGFETLVGDRGMLISPGQKQRIAVARSIIANPPILLLDEATSALDSQSEKIVQSALNAASRGRTTITIAHRLSTIRNADRIIVMDGGRIVESGSHDELMQLNAIYADLIKKQITEDQKISVDDSLDSEAPAEEDEEPQIASAVEQKRKISKTSSADNEMTEFDGTEKEVSSIEIIRRSKNEVLFVQGGMLCSFIAGAAQPAAAIILAQFFYEFPKPRTDEVLERVRMWCGLMFLFGCIQAVSTILQFYCFGVVGERLTTEYRNSLMRKFLSFRMTWFDEELHAPGVLNSILTSDTVTVLGLSGNRIGIFLGAVPILLITIIYGMYLDWRLTLVTLAIIPVMIVCSKVLMAFTMGLGKSEKSLLRETAAATAESFSAIRTLLSLPAGERYLSRVKELYLAVMKMNVKAHAITSLPLHLGQSIIPISAAICYSYGAKLVSWDLTEFGDVQTIFMLVTFGGMGIGRTMALLPDARKAQHAARHIYAVLNCDNVEDEETDGEREKPPSLLGDEGSIKFDKVSFAYPSRPDAKILRDISLTVENGQRVAIVGGSGSGKSTIIQLLQKFYDASGGEIAMNEKRIADIPASLLRNKEGIVTQEPVLFNISIRDNILYGVDSADDIRASALQQACIDANAHEFITTLSDGYGTIVGEGGSQLSGGQKQRIVIARAILRNPEIFLLDEATSALDAASEAEVQRALENASRNVTAVIVAHRLNTIKDVDKIIVLESGQIAEEGTHQQLLQRRGVYYELQQNQLS